MNDLILSWNSYQVWWTGKILVVSHLSNKNRKVGGNVYQMAKHKCNNTFNIQIS